MARVSVDFIRPNKPPRSGTHYTGFSIDGSLPIPAVGDDVVLTTDKRTTVVRIERRLFHYSSNSLYLQLYFKRVE